MRAFIQSFKISNKIFFQKFDLRTSKKRRQCRDKTLKNGIFHLKFFCRTATPEVVSRVLRPQREVEEVAVTRTAVGSTAPTMFTVPKAPPLKLGSLC